MLFRGFLVVYYIGFCACKWSAKAKIPKFKVESRKLKSFINIKAGRCVSVEAQNTLMNLKMSILGPL